MLSTPGSAVSVLFQLFLDPQVSASSLLNRTIDKISKVRFCFYILVNVIVDIFPLMSHLLEETKFVGTGVADSVHLTFIIVCIISRAVAKILEILRSRVNGTYHPPHLDFSLLAFQLYFLQVLLKWSSFLKENSLKINNCF